MKLTELQSLVKPWHEQNFPAAPAWQPLVGMQEELGELSHAFLKRAQNIRMDEDHDSNIRDALADIIVFMAHFANIEGIDLDEAVDAAWNNIVSKRDWRA